MSACHRVVSWIQPLGPAYITLLPQCIDWSLQYTVPLVVGLSVSYCMDLYVNCISSPVWPVSLFAVYTRLE